MTEGSGQAPAGWYADPHSSGRLRYFDGELWTNHYFRPGELPDLGNWISTTFGVFRQHWKGAAIIAVASTLVANLMLWLPVRAFLNDLAIVDQELVNFSGAKLVPIGVAVIASVLWTGFTNVALHRYLQRAHFNADPTIGDAAGRALQRLPRFVAVHMALALVVFLVVVLVVLVFFVTPILGVFVVLALVPAGVWALVKISFITSALAAAPSSAPILATSAGVSDQRFWGVLGRIVLVLITSAVIGYIANFATAGVSSPIDDSAASEFFRVEGDTIEVGDFRFGELFPSGADLVWFILVGTLIGAVTSMVTASAYMRLYLDSGAPSEL